MTFRAEVDSPVHRVIFTDPATDKQQWRGLSDATFNEILFMAIVGFDVIWGTGKVSKEAMKMTYKSIP